MKTDDIFVIFGYIASANACLMMLPQLFLTVKKKSFAEYNASKLRISATEKQAQATEIALEGVKQEFQLGTRTTLDILDAEQEYLDARVSFVTAKNDSNTSLFQLFYYLGTLTPENLNMDIKKYDPNKNYKRVRTIKIGPNRIKVIGNVD